MKMIHFHFTSSHMPSSLVPPKLNGTCFLLGYLGNCNTDFAWLVSDSKNLTVLPGFQAFSGHHKCVTTSANTMRMKDETQLLTDGNISIHMELILLFLLFSFCLHIFNTSYQYKTAASRNRLVLPMQLQNLLVSITHGHEVASLCPLPRMKYAVWISSGANQMILSAMLRLLVL